MLFPLKTRQTFVEEWMEEQKDSLLQRASEVENSFFSSVYLLSIDFAVIDACDFFVSLDCHSNYLRDLPLPKTPERGLRFYKILAMYQTIAILRKKRNDLCPSEMAKALYYVYDFLPEEKELFRLLYLCAVRFPAQYPVLFAKCFGRYLFSTEIDQMVSLAFLENFCYNSYHSLWEYLSKYISVIRRIRLARLAGNKRLIPPTA